MSLAPILLVVSAACGSVAPGGSPTRAEVHVVTAGDGVLPDDTVQCLFLDSRHRLWVGTTSGVATLTDGTWTRDQFDSRDPWFDVFTRHRGPTAITEGANGELYFAGMFGLQVLQAGEWRPFQPTCPVRPDMLLSDSRGSLWAAERGSTRLWRFDGADWEVALQRIDAPFAVQLLLQKNPNDRGVYPDFGAGFCELVEDGDGVVWVGARLGPHDLPQFNPRDMPWHSETKAWVPSSLEYGYELHPTGRPGHHEEPIAGAAPYAPLYRFDGRSWRAPRTGLRMARPIVGPDGSVEFETEIGTLDLDRLQSAERTKPLEYLDTLGPPRPPACGLRFAGRDGRMWIVEGDAVFVRRNGDVHRLAMSASDHSTFAAALSRGAAGGLEDADGRVWIGTAGAGLLRVEPR